LVDALIERRRPVDAGAMQPRQRLDRLIAQEQEASASGAWAEV